jgi:hypothetical protein
MMDKPVAEWQRRLRGMEPGPLTNAWKAKAQHELSWTEEPNYHLAVAERMKQLGYLAIDLDDDVRTDMCRQANDIVNQLRRHLAEDIDKLEEIDNVTESSNVYYEKFGKKTARYYMYEQGVIDVLGDRLVG